MLHNLKRDSQEATDLRILIFLILVSGSMIMAGCQAVPVNTGPSEEIIPTEVFAPASPTQGENQMTPSDPGLQGLLEKAKTDLAQRLSVLPEEIAIVQATSVTWPDGSLGCPQEGMVYAQVLTPGYLIRLQSGDQKFEYHASRGTEVVYCENPMPPVEGTPGDV